MRDQLLFFVNGKRCEVRGPSAFVPLSSYLRYELGLTGTKVTCAEGDCGSCAVLLGRPVGEAMSYAPITSCIHYLYQLDGTHIITIEGLSYDGNLNPIQEAIVRGHGSQCGFCTPGFVVTLAGLLNSRKHLDDAALRHGLTGNLCRCTGYDPILRAARAIPPHELRSLDELYPPESMLPELLDAARESVLVSSGEKRFLKPATIEDAVRFKADNPGCVVVAGGTDVGVQLNKGMRQAPVVLSLSSLGEMSDITLIDGMLIVGATATLAELERRTQETCPELARMLWRHGSGLIRNAGTLAGNIANGSPIGDTMPALFVLDARIELAGAAGRRMVNINDFYTGYRKTVIASDEIITRIQIPLPSNGDTFRLYKVSKRHDLDISTFTAGFLLRLADGVVADIRIAYGGVAPVILRLRKTEQALRGRPFTSAEVEAVIDTALGEIAPITDVRGAADYRGHLAAGILRKFHAETSGQPVYDRQTPRAPLRPPAPSGNGDGQSKGGS